MTVHWCGTGLSSIPGLKRLLESDTPVQVWNRSVDKAHAALAPAQVEVNPFDLDALKAALKPGDIVVSMLPPDWHVKLANAAIEAKADFVCSSYIAPEMRALDTPAKLAEVRVVNEVGLDPGIDHLMAHWLVDDYRRSGAYASDNTISFTSYCGGVPKEPNAFRYKFSWSPLGVLNALTSPSRSIKAFSQLDMKHPWEAILRYTAPLPTPEVFEVYPNRDSLPFIADYNFEPTWKIREFVRGTLRLMGWENAWSDVFKKLEELENDPKRKDELNKMSDQFWQENAYRSGEADRVILSVSLKAERDGKPVYHKTYLLDAFGDERGSAMARLVSEPMTLAVEAILQHEIPVGVTSAPSDPKLVRRWLDHIDHLSQYKAVVDHLK